MKHPRKQRRPPTVIIIAQWPWAPERYGALYRWGPHGSTLSATGDSPTHARRILRAVIRRYKKTGVLL